jgi:hypothetical protein
VCTVTLTNAGGSPISAPSLSSESVETWYGHVGTDIRFKREPVRSPKETGAGLVTVQPGESVSREFVNTRLTEEEGDFVLHVMYRFSEPAGEMAPPLIAPGVLFKVTGPVLFRRDVKGVLLKDEAVRVAAERAGGSVARSSAILVRNEAGFLDWWVDVEVVAQGTTVKRSFLVNPYTGAVRAEAQPHGKPPGSPSHESGE